MGRLLRRGALAGALAGLAMAAVLLAVGERSIGDAIALEERAAAASGHAHDDAPYSRPEQVAGGVAGVVVYGAALGTVFAVAFAATRRRAGAGDEWRAAVALAGAGFVAVFLVPWLKYPANPPGVGDPATIGRRTALYLVLLAWSAVAAWAAWRTSRWLAATDRPDHVRGPAAALAWVALAAAGLVLLPASPDPVAAPADLVWRFRLATAAGAAAFWATLGAAFGALSLRAAAARAPSPRHRLAAGG